MTIEEEKKEEVIEAEMRRMRRSPDYTIVCSHCGTNLHMKKEYEDERCDRCQGIYEAEMDAIYGDE